jgi:hypothetical protein
MVETVVPFTLTLASETRCMTARIRGDCRKWLHRARLGAGSCGFHPMVIHTYSHHADIDALLSISCNFV